MAGLPNFQGVSAIPDLLRAFGLEVGDALWGAFTTALGDPANLSDLSGLSQEDVDAVLRDLRVRKPGEEAPVAITPVQKSRLRNIVAGARTVIGSASGQSSGQPSAAAGAQAQSLGPGRRVKLSSIVDPSAEADVVLLSGDVVRDMFDRYKAAHGSLPREDAEPTSEQLSALQQLAQAKASPYVDFALFGPHGRRLLRKLTFTDHVFLPETGSWRRVELPGPPDLDAWLRSWHVFETAVLLLRQVRTERLRAYAEHIRGFVLQFGPQCWPIVYQADVRFRSEHFDRMWRQAESLYYSLSPEAQRSAAFSPALPWDSIFGQALAERDFWDREVREKCLLFLTRVKSQAALLSDNTVADLSPAASGPFPMVAPGPGSSSKKRKNAPQGKGSRPAAPAQQKVPRKNSAPARGGGGREICRKFNAGVCQEPCPQGRLHSCAVCGGPHPETSCKKPAKPGKGSGSKGGKQ